MTFDLDQTGVPDPLSEFPKPRTDDIEVSRVLRIRPEVDSSTTKQCNEQDDAISENQEWGGSGQLDLGSSSVLPLWP